MKDKIIGGIMALVVISIPALLFSLGLDIPFPSVFLVLSFVMNAVYAFVSIFVQRWVMYLYKVNVFIEPGNAFEYGFKYFTIYSSGLNYYMQNICNRLPYILNKIVAAIFCIYLLINFIALGMIFS